MPWLGEFHFLKYVKIWIYITFRKVPSVEII